MHVTCVTCMIQHPWQRAPSSACISAVSPQYIIVHPAAGWAALPSSVKHRQSSSRDKNAPLACKEQQVIISKCNRPHSCECTPADQQPCAPTFTSAPHNPMLVQTIKTKQPSSQSCSGGGSSNSLPPPLTSHHLSSAPRCHRPRPSACGWISWPAACGRWSCPTAQQSAQGGMRSAQHSAGTRG
jgi:hypothetical protein